MQSKFEDRRVLTLEIEADVRTGYDEITPFLTAIKKVIDKSKRPGFVREFNKNERSVLVGLWDYLKPYYEVDSGSNTTIVAKV